MFDCFNAADVTVSGLSNMRFQHRRAGDVRRMLAGVMRVDRFHSPPFTLLKSPVCRALTGIVC